MGIVRTQKFLDEPTLKRLTVLAVEWQRTPMILLTQRHLGPHGKTEDVLARERFYKALDEAAVAAGQPEPAVDEDGDVIHYGADFETGEILLWDGKVDEVTTNTNRLVEK